MNADVQAYADRSISRGSQSFAAASRLFDEATRRDVAKLYAWCRYCDDVVDGQEGGHGSVVRENTASDRLDVLEAETRAALAGGIVAHPVFACLAEVARRHGIPDRLPLAHLAGFRMDVEQRRFPTLGDLMFYCYGVAGVVGMMITYVMTDRATRARADFGDTLDRACDLGLAFQLTNIARDVIDDADAGRVYLPLEWLTDSGISPEKVSAPANRAAVAGVAARLVEAAEPYYASARGGIGALPLRAAWAVDAARGVYRAIGCKVVERGPAAWDFRVSTSRSEKLRHLAEGGTGALLSRVERKAPRPSELWTRPR